ncbi:microtubule-associated tumor suppressor candidate 2 isoform X1 [Scleropages formosus]|nr:microtubule-associated tumor suppressor candidate 2-like isoform X1 [Scleropages formosus]XP_029111679.1 microtubule-associated tumor suppressor candidate 2-like isoform X1 [Scleropages formosus]
MNVPSEHRGPLGPDFQDHQFEMKNNNRQVLYVPKGDANANQVQEPNATTESRSDRDDTGSLPPLVSQHDEQDKVIIWGTDSQCDDPDLEEFEMLECQELEACLVEEERDYEKAAGARCGSLSDTQLSLVLAGKEMSCDGEEGRVSRWNLPDQEFTNSHSPGARAMCVTADFSSENDVFVSCVSTMSVVGGSFCSALDSTAEIQALESQHTSADRNRTISEDLTLVSQSPPSVPVKNKTPGQSEGSAQGNMASVCVDMNLNSTITSYESHRELEKTRKDQRSPSLDSGPEECTHDLMDTTDMDVDLHQEHFQRTEGYHNGWKLKTSDENGSSRPLRSDGARHKVDVQSGCPASPSRRMSHKVNGRLPRDDEVSSSHPKVQMGKMPAQPPSVDSKALRKQGSFERNRSASPSLEKKAQLARRPWGSPSRPATPPSPKTTGSPVRRPPMSPARATSHKAPPQERHETSKLPGKTPCPSSGIPKPILHHPSRPEEKAEPETRSGRSPTPSAELPKPKNVRPKIITSIRRSPQGRPHPSALPYEASTLPCRLTSQGRPLPSRESKAVSHPHSHTKAPPILSDKYRHEVEKACCLNQDLVVSGIRPSGHTGPHRLMGKSESFCEGLYERGRGAAVLEGPGYEDPPAPSLGQHRAMSLSCSPRIIRPQLGLGAVTRLPSAKTRMLFAGQRSALPPGHSARAASPPAFCCLEIVADQRKPGTDPPAKSLIPQPGYSGLRPPGFTRLPAGRLATFGFIRSASVSSASSHQLSDRPQGEPRLPIHRHSGTEEASVHRAAGHLGETQPQAPGRSSPHPPVTSLLPSTRGSPLASRKELQKEADAVRPGPSSPKRFAAVLPKPQSPVHARHRAAAGSRPGGPGGSPWRGGSDGERQLVQHLRGRCEEQERQLHALRAELSRVTLGLEVFAVATQHFCQKSESAAERKRELSLELARIRDEVASSVARWECLQRDKDDLERSFQKELQGLRAKQRAELGALEEGLKARHAAESERLRAEQRADLEVLHMQQREKVEEMSINHEAALLEVENAHMVALATLQEEHTRTVKDLKEAHEEQRRVLEQDFEKLRLSLQDQVDTLTFQNHSLRDRAKRFEEALRRSTDEQIVDALAPYQHIEEDLKSLKEVLEMKNQQIHKQELKISELEKMAQKNVVLEERLQVLQQQNEDLKARIDRNLAMSRQLSEENANLQVYVEKETNEKKRLSRTNEELLWRLQTGELSPRMLSPSSSPVHRASPGPGSPARFQPLPR